MARPLREELFLFAATIFLMGVPLRPYPPTSSLMAVEILEHWKKKLLQQIKKVPKSFFFYLYKSIGKCILNLLLTLYPDC